MEVEEEVEEEEEKGRIREGGIVDLSVATVRFSLLSISLQPNPFSQCSLYTSGPAALVGTNIPPFSVCLSSCLSVSFTLTLTHTVCATQTHTPLTHRHTYIQNHTLAWTHRHTAS